MRRNCICHFMFYAYRIIVQWQQFPDLNLIVLVYVCFSTANKKPLTWKINVSQIENSEFSLFRRQNQSNFLKKPFAWERIKYSLDINRLFVWFCIYAFCLWMKVVKWHARTNACSFNTAHHVVHMYVRPHIAFHCYKLICPFCDYWFYYFCQHRNVNDVHLVRSFVCFFVCLPSKLEYKAKYISHRCHKNSHTKCDQI